VVTVGKATLDIFLFSKESNKHFRLDRETHEICIKSGDKAIVDSSYFLTGGNANNVAIGLSRMGFKAAIIAEIGADEFSQKIINTLKKEGVSTSFLKQTPHQPSSFSVILNVQGDRTIFEENIVREHDFSFEGVNTKWIYLTSMENKWQKAYEKTLDFVKKNNVKLAFNPGTTQLDDDLSQIEETIALSEILFVNKEEAARICGFEITNDESFVPHLLSQVKSKGAKTVVITDGARGAFMIDSLGTVHFGEPSEASVLERTGAGDAFASGFLSAVLASLSGEDAMKWGSKNASSVIGKIGAQEGLLKKDSI